jgi:hypothetical protein
MADTKHKTVEQVMDGLKTELSKLDWALLIKDKQQGIAAIDTSICRLMELADVLNNTSFDYAAATTQA